MNKKRLVLAGVAAILALGIVLCITAQYKRQENTTKMLASIHELDDVLSFAEHKGADYAADELLYLHTRNYTKDDLHLKWGEPNKSNADPNEDIWLLSDKYQLLIGYGDREDVWSIRVLSNLQNTDTELYDANSLTEQDLISVFTEVREPEWEYVDCAIFRDLAYGQIGAVLFWNEKTETSSVAFFDEDGCFQQCGTHARMAENPDFTYLGNGKVTYQMQTDAGEIYTYVLTISIDESGVHFVAEDNLNPTELPGVYDINHNGEPEVFTLTWDRTSLTGSGYWTLSLLENNSEIWCDYAGLDHAGANTVFAVKIDGKDYLLRYSPDMGQGIADYWYEIFSLDENGVETLWKRNGIEFDVNFGSGTHRPFDPEKIARFLQEVHSWLNDDSELLFSTEDGIFCSGGSGVSFRGDKFWGDTWYDPEKSLEENLRIYAEELTRIRTDEEKSDTAPANDPLDAPAGDVITDIAYPSLTLATLKDLVDRAGDNLTWTDFSPYYSEDIGSGLYVLRYPIGMDYSLLIGGESMDTTPMYIRLVAERNAESYIDVRTDSIDNFVNAAPK